MSIAVCLLGRELRSKRGSCNDEADKAFAMFLLEMAELVPAIGGQLENTSKHMKVSSTKRTKNACHSLGRFVRGPSPR